ncbi:MAG: DUF1592 domain-containing protein, partial [Verrucomicrobiales bacterium]|nr:DUF1592 domain-containing protein [Verrucomicrobiales bacterium]
EMPPENKKQIPNEEKAEFLAELSVQMVRARNILADSGGEITMRRLNRREYSNTLRELLGFLPNVTSLPDDDETGGFDTSGASLYMSSDQFEQYRATARTALEYTFPTRPRPEPTTRRIEGETISKAVFEDAAIQIDLHKRATALLNQDELPAKEFGFQDRRHAARKAAITMGIHGVYEYYYLSRPETKTGMIPPPGGLGKPLYGAPFKRVPLFRLKPNYSGGTYRIRVRGAAYDEAPERNSYVTATFLEGKNSYTKLRGLAKFTAPLSEPEIVEMEVLNPTGSRGTFRIGHRAHAREEVPWINQQWKKKNGIGRPPTIWIDYVEIEGPFFDERLAHWPQQMERIREETDSKEAYVRELISTFAREAFRGMEPSAEFLDKLVNYYHEGIKFGDDSRSAMLDSLALVLSSPSFLYLIEPRADGEDRTQLNDIELANRLAYFLWGSPPDEQLLAKAQAGNLSNPGVLSAEVDRLLVDLRSERFVSGFAHQWLDMKRIDMFDSSAKLHPEFDYAVRRSARQEIYETIEHLIDERLPIDALLKSDFVVIDDILAQFYQIEGVRGSEFRPVSVPAGSPRGGLLGTAAIHIMGSDGLRSSPVERGVWVLRHLLNDPPPPAPPNVPMLEHDEIVAGVRDLQKRHQEEAQCASCHQKIDPIGYGLENFTAAGLWRNDEQVEILADGVSASQSKYASPEFRSFPIDPSGALPRGETFESYEELRDGILENYSDDFARGLTE